MGLLEGRSKTFPNFHLNIKTNKQEILEKRINEFNLYDL